MSKKFHSTGYPRKFIDKIALIKQKEALTNAYFESAIQGLSDISMKRLPTNEDIIHNKVYPNRIDEFSNTSFSPQSFTSDSTPNNPQSNENYYHKTAEHIKDVNNDVFNNFFEKSESSSFQNLQTYGDIKFRHGSDNMTSQFPQARFSNIEGYPCFNNSLTRDINEQVSSGSLPDVSSFDSRKYVNSDFSERHSYEMPHCKEVNPDSLSLKIISKKVKKGTNSKKALFEHLRNRGIQNQINLHPHHIGNAEQANINLASILGSPSMNRNRVNYIHNHDSPECAANNSESGHLKHYSATNSPYLSLPVRDVQGNKDCDNSYRKRHCSGNVISPPNQMELQLNCTSEINNCELKYKSLTPTESMRNNWLNAPKQGHLLPPNMYDMMTLDNCRRASSDSSIQNSLKQCTSNMIQPNFMYNNDASTFGRIRNNKNEASFPVYERIQSMTDPCNNSQEPLNNTQKINSLQRDLSHLSTSSFLDNYITPNSPDENLDPNIDHITSPDKIPRQQFRFGDFNKLPDESDINIPNNPRCSFINDDHTSSLISNPNQFNDMIISSNNCSFEANIKQEMDIKRAINTQAAEHYDQCYWTNVAESNAYNYSKEPSPKIKPCENLDPQNVAVDPNTDFSGIPDIVLSEADAQRRDSLNWADEVLSNLNMESNSEFIPCRDKLTGFNNFYQPLDMLTEENVVKNFENEY